MENFRQPALRLVFFGSMSQLTVIKFYIIKYADSDVLKTCISEARLPSNIRKCLFDFELGWKCGKTGTELNRGRGELSSI